MGARQFGAGLLFFRRTTVRSLSPHKEEGGVVWQLILNVSPYVHYDRSLDDDRRPQSRTIDLQRKHPERIDAALEILDE
jgi:hypothetical protein